MLAADLDIARVQPHPHAELAHVAPVLGGNRALTVDGGPNSVAGAGEGGVHAVTQGFEDDAAVGLDSAAQQVVMTAHRRPHCMRVLLQQARAPLDVSEEERDGSSW